MNILKVKKGDCLHIIWLDSATYGPGWTYEDIKPRAKRIETIGFVKALSKEAVLITSTQSASGGSLAPLAIPIGCIESYNILEVRPNPPNVQSS